MSAAGSYSATPMPRLPAGPPLPDDDARGDAVGAPGDAELPRRIRVGGTRRDVADLPVLGLTRRHAGYLAGALVAAWILVMFTRQVSEAADASTRAEALRVGNAELAIQVEALEQELALIRRQAYVVQQARTYGFGAGREIAFVLADDAPPLPADAPGSASVKLGAATDRRAPIDAWLDLLFGPGD